MQAVTLGAVGKEHTKHHGINDAAHKSRVGYPSKHWCGSQDLVAEPPSAEGIPIAFVQEVQVDFDMFVTRDLLCLLVNLPPMVYAFLGVFASGDLRKQIFEKMLRMKRQRSFTPAMQCVRKMETKQTQTQRNRKLYTRGINIGQKNQGTCILVESNRNLEEAPSASALINSTKKQNATIIQQK